MQRWLSVAAGPLAHGVAKVRWTGLSGGTQEAAVVDMANQLLRVLDQHLASHRFLASDERPTVADIALYSYTARVTEGGISLEPHVHLRRWLTELEALPRFLPMPSTEPFAGKPT